MRTVGSLWNEIRLKGIPIQATFGTFFLWIDCNIYFCWLPLHHFSLPLFTFSFLHPIATHPLLLALNNSHSGPMRFSLYVRVFDVCIRPNRLSFLEFTVFSRQMRSAFASKEEKSPLKYSTRCKSWIKSNIKYHPCTTTLPQLTNWSATFHCVWPAFTALFIIYGRIEFVVAAMKDVRACARREGKNTKKKKYKK